MTPAEIKDIIQYTFDRIWDFMPLFGLWIAAHMISAARGRVVEVEEASKEGPQEGIKL